MQNSNAAQRPIGSGFTATSTATDVIKGIDLSGKNAVVTGGYAGIGLETVRVLSGAGARIWIPARDIEKARKNLAGIANLRILPMDLMQPQTINAFADAFIAEDLPLHLLINNAGIMWVPLRRDERGYESQLATNHLGHFQLTARLWPALKNAERTRVVNVSSFGHQIAPFNFDDPNYENRAYETLQAYGESKSANNLFTVGLDARGKVHGIRSYALHPGSVNHTDLGREAPMALFRQMGTHDANGNIFPEVALRLKTPAQGAATTIWCATSPQLDDIGGVYCEDADIAEIDNGQIEHRYDEPSSLRGVRPYSIDAQAADRLWELSESRCGLKFEAQ